MMWHPAIQICIWQQSQARRTNLPEPMLEEGRCSQKEKNASSLKDTEKLGPHKEQATRSKKRKCI